MTKRQQSISQALLRLLLDKTEAAAGVVPRTPADFFHMRLAMEDRIGEALGESTMKRLWGYVDSVETPRFSTLDVLARFCGYKGLCEFVAEAEAASDVQSDLRTADGSILHAADLAEGARIAVSWLPDREVTLRHIDGYRFSVESNRNSKLSEGDTVEIVFLEQRQPLYADIVSPDGTRRSYVVGSRDGISFKPAK